jgi:hypothetical protein
MNSGSMREGIVGVVNELLVQMQSFDCPMGKDKRGAGTSTWSTAFLPRSAPAPSSFEDGQHPGHRRHQPGRRPRPRRCCAPAGSTVSCTSISRPAPDRIEIADYYLAKKSHDTRSTARGWPT